MGLTIAEKLIAASLVEGEMKRGNRIGIHIAQTLTHDVTGVMSYLELEAIGINRVKTNHCGERAGISFCTKHYCRK